MRRCVNRSRDALNPAASAVARLGAVLWLGCVPPGAAAGTPEAGTARCIEEAAARHRVPPSLIRAILSVEGGRSGQAVRNANGTVDVGPMQINSAWLPALRRMGVTLELLQHHPCANIHFGAWILGRELARVDPARLDRAAFWRAIGNYHSRTPELNARYAERVWRAWRRGDAGHGSGRAAKAVDSGGNDPKLNDF